MSTGRDSVANGDPGWHRRPNAAPTVAELLALDQHERDSGLWDEDFLVLGSRLRPVYGNRVSLSTGPPAYQVSFPHGLTVSVGCIPERDDRVTVRVWVRVIELELLDTPGIFQFALRENAELALARLAVREQWLTVEHELPFCGICIPALEASVSTVAVAAARLRSELHTVFGCAAA